MPKGDALLERKECKIARKVWADKPRLKTNMSATGRVIEAMRDERLKRGAHSYLGADTIRKHLGKVLE